MSSTAKSLALGLSLALLVVLGLGFLSVAGTRFLLHQDYPQGTPEEVLASARKMIENGDAHRLPDLVYADTPQMRGLLNELGQVLGSLQDLATQVAAAYPDEIAALTAQAEAAAKSGQATSFIQRLAGEASANMGRRGRDRRNADPAAMRKLFDNAAKEVFADPYGWLARSEGRITVQTLTSDTAAILWDKKPVFGVGLMMRESEGSWYISLPTNMPVVSRAMPKSEESWMIMGNLMDVFDNTIKDLTKDVRSGKIAKLDDLARKAGEKAFIPAAITVFAFSKAMEAERKEQKARQQAATPKPAGT
jgi:hypothetical protein